MNADAPRDLPADVASNSDGALDGASVPDAGPATRSLTSCRDLFPSAQHVAAARGGRFFVLSNSLGASVLDSQNRHVVRTFAGTRGTVVGSALSPDSSWAATVGSDKLLRVWRVAYGCELATAELVAIPWLIVVDGAGTRLAVLDPDGTVTVFDKDAKPLWHETWSADGQPKPIRFSADDETLFVATAGGVERRTATHIRSSAWSRRLASHAPTVAAAGVPERPRVGCARGRSPRSASGR